MFIYIKKSGAFFVGEITQSQNRPLIFVVAFSGELNIIPDTSENTSYFGVTAGIGVGTPSGEVHVELCNTVTSNIARFNVFDKAKEAYIKIMEW